MKLFQRYFLQIFSTLFMVSIIFNLYLSLHETNRKYESLMSYFEKFNNISYPVKYSLKFYGSFNELPEIYVITPTNNKLETQMAHLTRMRNTLWLVPKIVWILIEDSQYKTKKISNFLIESNLNFVHLCKSTPDFLTNSLAKPRGVLQRNKGIDWLRENSHRLQNGVVYFADDDNTYDIRIFEEMRYTKKVSVWPVAFVGFIMYEGPICKDGKVVDWFRAWVDDRPFPIDMAGFAINLKLLLDRPLARFSFRVKPGMQESHILSRLVQLNELEPKADNCTKIYVWHTQTQKILRDRENLIEQMNLSYNNLILDQV